MKRSKGEIEKRLRALGEIEAANYIGGLEGTLKEANERVEKVRQLLVLQTKENLRILKRWGMHKP